VTLYTAAYLFLTFVILFFAIKIVSPIYKAPLYIFTLFFVVYNFFSQIVLMFSDIQYIELNSSISLYKAEYIKVYFYIILFYFIFCNGLIVSSMLENKKIHFKSINLKTYIISYKMTLATLLMFILIFFFLTYSQILFENYSYIKNQRTNFGLFALLKDLIIFLLFLFFFIKKRGLISTIFFCILIAAITFILKDKDSLLYILIAGTCYFNFFHKKKINYINFLLLLIIIFIFLYYFFPFFSIYRVEGFNYAANAVFIKNYRTLGDPSSSFAALYMLLHDIIYLENFNFFFNITSFLPSELRLNGDYGIMFAKQILGDDLKPGQGLSFSVLNETIVYLKAYGFIAFILIAFWAGFYFGLIIKICYKFSPKFLENNIIIFFSVFMSFEITRSTFAGLHQFSIRYLIILFFISIITKFIDFYYNKIAKKFN
jgi:hypothetical protein